MPGINSAQASPSALPPSVTEAGHQAANVGSYGGQTVTQPSIASLVQDSLEELPSNLSEKISKKLADRKAKKKSSSEIETLLRKYLQSVKGTDKAEKFHSLSQSLKQLSKPTPQQIRDLLDEHFGHRDSDDANIKDYEAALLLALEEHLSTDGGSEALLNAVRDAKSDLGERLQSFYQEDLRAYEGVGQVYENVLGADGGSDFMEATDALITRLGNDLNGQGRAMDSTHLNSTLESLYHLEVARNTFEAFTELGHKMQSMFGVSTEVQQ
ncbi:MAG: hypothetical protein AAFX06_09240 [Planctomycetota bacterium]